MDLFKEIVNESLLNEIRQERYEDIKKAINNVLRVRMGYSDGKGGKGKNERYILPVAFGITKNGKKAVRAYQSAGSSKRGYDRPTNDAAARKNPSYYREKPYWKLFLVDNIFSWSNGKRSFAEYKDTLIRRGLNTSGDKAMTTIFAITPFADDDVMVAKNDAETIKSTPVTKFDVQPAKSNDDARADKKIFEPEKDVKKNTIDKTQKQDYIQNKINVKDTEPVRKDDITTQNQGQDVVDREAETDKINASGTEPITKSDINGTESGTEQQQSEKDRIKADFSSMMDRMNNLYKDEEDNEE